MDLAKDWPVLNHTVFVSASINFKWEVYSFPQEATVLLSSFLPADGGGEFCILEVRGVNLRAEVSYSSVCVLVFAVTHVRSEPRPKNIEN